MIKNLDSIFPEEKDKKEAAEHLRVLYVCKGWQILSQFIDDDIKEVETALKTKKFEKTEEITLLQQKLAHLTILKNLPIKLREALLGEKEIEELDFDVY